MLPIAALSRIVQHRSVVDLGLAYTEKINLSETYRPTL